MKPVEEHLAECLAAVAELEPEPTALLDALDCVLAEDVASPVDLPGFDNSAMDGFAVRLPDVLGAAEDRPVVLDVVADLAAGARPDVALTPGGAARIMTGAAVPEGTDAVVPVEWTGAATPGQGPGDRGGFAAGRHGADRVEVRRAPGGGQFVRRAGEDVRRGEVVLTAGTRLTPRHVALLAAVGRAQVLVRRAPRVAVLSSGSELVEPGRPLGPGQVYESNGYGITAAVLELGAQAHRVGAVADDAATLLRVIRDRVASADLVVTSGGVSAGAYDTVKEVLRGLGTVRFDKVAMQPGMPQGFGTVDGDGGRSVPIFTLPGNPVSARVSFEVFVRPVVRKMAGETSLHRHTVLAAATTGWASPPGKRQFVRAVLHRADDGSRLVTPVGDQGSHLVADLAGATCLAVVPEDVSAVRAGHEVRCMLLDRVRR